MNDLFNLPPRRELPDATRYQARGRIVLGIRGEPRPRRPLLPISIAATTVALVGGAALLVALQHPGSSNNDLTSAAASAGLLSNPQTGLVVLGPAIGGAALASTPADDITRCAAEDARDPAGRPDPAQWRPLFTTAANGIDVTAFHTSAGPLFCEVTPAMVTLSSPTGATAGATPRPTFVTAFGTVAGVFKRGPGWQQVTVKTTDRTSQVGKLVSPFDGVFVAVNAVHVPAPSLTFTIFDNPRSGRRVVAPDVGRLAVAPTQDRPLTPADQTSPEGRRLAQCLANPNGPQAIGSASGGPTADPAGWVPGESAPLDDHETVQLGTYDGLLAVCTFGTRQHPDLSLSVINTTSAAINPYLVTNPYLSVAEVTHAKTYGLIALVGAVKSAKVATVTLSSKGKPTITATVHSGTFVLSGSGVKAYVTPNVDPRGTITVLSASGTVLAKLSLH